MRRPARRGRGARRLLRPGPPEADARRRNAWHEAGPRLAGLPGLPQGFRGQVRGPAPRPRRRERRRLRDVPPPPRPGREARDEEGRQRPLLHVPFPGRARAEQGPRSRGREERVVRGLPQPARIAARPPPVGRADPGLLPVPRQGGVRAAERARGAAGRGVLGLSFRARLGPAGPPRPRRADPVPRVPPGGRAIVRQGPRRVPGRAGLLLHLPQPAQLCPAQAPEDQRPCARRRGPVRDVPFRAGCRAALRRERDGRRCAPGATMPPP